MTKKDHNKLPKTTQDFLVVGLGASAGGIEAIKKVVSAIPKNSGIAYVIVLHLHPEHESILPEILAKHTEIPVYEIKDEINLVPDTIYVIPENKLLISVDGILKLEARDPAMSLNLSIDIFFNSLGITHQNNAAGVVLSGMGSDGTMGLKAIKKYGGITLAQEPSSAIFSSMPQNAINQGAVDYILVPEEIPAQLIKANNFNKNKNFSEEEKSVPKSYEEVLSQIIVLIRQQKGIDFSYYKEPTLKRRIARRMGLNRIDNIYSYYTYLQETKDELDSLQKDFLIPVTSFFRDTKTFQSLTEVVFPRLLNGQTNVDPIRVWVAGCSSGEEAYSIAINLHEFLADLAPQTKIQIFATDISESNIAKARLGIYNALDVQVIPPYLQSKYFVKLDNGSFQVSKGIRDTCIFAVHNFLKDPPFSKIDLVSCRNVLIYMTIFLQKKALTTFHYALKETGTLWLGKSETISVASDLFMLISNNDKFFSRKYATASRFIQTPPITVDELLNLKNDMPSLPLTSQADFQKKAEEIILDQYSPPCVIVSDQNDIIHFSGDTSFFFAPAQGKASFNIMKMIRKELSFDLRSLLHKAQQKKERVSKDNIVVKLDNESFLICIEVIPILESVATHYLIVFPKKTLLQSEEELKKSRSRKSKKDLAEQLIQQLEGELAQTRQDILNITESQETANEELQSANEELLSSSEELQTLNEELETSKEELQSSNEELSTMNQELLNRQEHLNQAHAQMEALNNKLSIQNRTLEEAQANAQMGTITWNLQTNELNYSANLLRILGYDPDKNAFDWAQIGAHVHPGDLSAMEEVKRNVFTEKKVNEQSFRIITKDGALKYIRSNGSIIQIGKEDIVVIVLQDVSRDLLLTRNLQTRKAILTEAQELGKIGSWEVDFINNTIQWSEDTYRIYGYEPFEIPVDLDTIAGVHPDDILELKALIENSKVTGDKFEAEYRRYNKAGNIRYIHSRGNIRKDNDGRITGMLCVSMDITELHDKEVKLKEAYGQLKAKNFELERSNAELAAFSYIASHDLQEPLRKIETFTQRILEKEVVPDTMQDYFSRIVRASKRMRSLLSDLLNYSRMNAGNDIFVPTDLNTVLEEAKNSLSEKIEEKNVIIEADHLPTLAGIPTQFYQLFMNLISNSIKYCKQDTVPQIVIKAAILTGEQIADMRSKIGQKFWQISFEDNGIGFEQDNENKVFELFQRLHGKSEYEGTGIGLTICRKVVQNHNGFITVKSEPNNGTIFKIYLPINE